MEQEQIKSILEAALLAAGRPLALNDLEQLFAGEIDAPSRADIRAALAGLGEDWQGRSLALQEVASGFRAQVRDEFEPWLARLWDEKPARYSRALLETLAIIAYRQPITRSEIEEIRGVSVSTQIMRTLSEREWIRVVGHRDAPGRPAMYGTTREFLDHFNLKTLDQLPDLSELEHLNGHPELEFEQEPAEGQAGEGVAARAASPGADPDASDAGEAEAEEVEAEEVEAEEVEAEEVEAEEVEADASDAADRPAADEPEAFGGFGDEYGDWPAEAPAEADEEVGATNADAAAGMEDPPCTSVS